VPAASHHGAGGSANLADSGQPSAGERHQQLFKVSRVAGVILHGELPVGAAQQGRCLICLLTAWLSGSSILGGCSLHGPAVGAQQQQLFCLRSICQLWVSLGYALRRSLHGDLLIGAPQQQHHPFQSAIHKQQSAGSSVVCRMLTARRPGRRSAAAATPPTSECYSHTAIGREFGGLQNAHCTAAWPSERRSSAPSSSARSRPASAPRNRRSAIASRSPPTRCSASARAALPLLLDDHTVVNYKMH
jgi:hypothetical protein